MLALAPLQQALFVGLHMVGHHGLHRRSRQPPEGDDRRGEPEPTTGRRKAYDVEPRRPERQSGRQRNPIAEPLHEPSHNADLHRRQGYADCSQRCSEGQRRPVVTVHGVEDDGGGQGHLRQGRQELRRRQRHQIRVTTKQDQRSERIGLLPRQRRTHIFWQRLRQDKEAISRVDQAKAPRHPKRRARTEILPQDAS